MPLESVPSPPEDDPSVPGEFGSSVGSEFDPPMSDPLDPLEPVSPELETVALSEAEFESEFSPFEGVPSGPVSLALESDPSLVEPLVSD